jgi:hypothetical protein
MNKNSVESKNNINFVFPDHCAIRNVFGGGESLYLLA